MLSSPMVDAETFDDIRPYNDAEVRPVLARLLADDEFLDTMVHIKMPNTGKMATALMRPVVRKAIAHETAQIETVAAFQARIERYMQRVLDDTVTELSVTGLDHLHTDRPHLFISNHRDIAMDPALVNWVLYHNQFNTLRVAIGDNLLTKPFAADLMRLNKCFIVNRSATAPREKLKAAKRLAQYIQHSLHIDGANIWLAQREGRAKDGRDRTNPAIVSMLALPRDKSQPFSEFMAASNIVPVSISYEWDPLDVAKARELTLLRRDGTYTKAQHEDVQSIAKGITGKKGRVHLAFGAPLAAELDDHEAVVAALDAAIVKNFVLFPSHCFAYHHITGEWPSLPVGAAGELFDRDDRTAAAAFEARLEACPAEYREVWLEAYANPVRAQLAQLRT